MRFLQLLSMLWLATISTSLGAGYRRAILQDSTERTDESFISSSLQGIPFLQELSMGEPVTGTVSAIEAVMFGFSIERRDRKFPNILLSLVVSQPGGSADLFCSPLILDGRSFRLPSSIDAVWQSNHTEGADFVFISRNHTSLLENVRELNTPQGVELFVDVLCSLSSSTPFPSNFELELDADFGDRSLVKRELESIQSMFQKCCEGKDACTEWRAMESVIFGANESDDLPPFDLCHVPGNVCDESGKLIRLNMDGWGLECDFPLAELKTLVKLQKLDVSNNNLTGDIFEIAKELNSLKHLVEFRAKDNALNGSVNTDRLCKFVRGNMTILSLEGNEITGPMPDCLFDFTTTLRELNLAHNNLSSSIPDVFPENSTLEMLILEDNSLNGSLPSSMANMTVLRSINVQDNSLSGSLPDNAFMSPQLSSVELRNNKLSGKLPSSLATSNSLLLLDVTGNSFTELPEKWITGNLTRTESGFLNAVSLARNNFTGEFPQAFTFLPRLGILDVSNNNFTGSLPGNPNMFLRTWALIFANNSFSGTISNNWGSAGILTGSALAGITGPPILDLTNNLLTGEIPDAFLNVDVLPPDVFLAQSIRLGGNDLNCPENRTIFHLQGLDCGR